MFAFVSLVNIIAITMKNRREKTQKKEIGYPEEFHSNSEWWQTLYNDDVWNEIYVGHKRFILAQAEVEQILKRIGKTNSTINPQTSVLDVPCGQGRHSFVFADLGYQVTGIDFSSKQIALAKNHIKDLKTENCQVKSYNLSFKEGNMLDLSTYQIKYDIVTCLWNSWGYFEEVQQNWEALKQLLNAVKPEGYFVLNNVHKAGVAYKIVRESEGSKNYRTSREETNSGTAYNLFWASPNANKYVGEVILLKKDGTYFRQIYEQKIFALEDIREFIRQEGFKEIDLWGNLDSDEEFEENNWYFSLAVQKIH